MSSITHSRRAPRGLARAKAGVQKVRRKTEHGMKKMMSWVRKGASATNGAIQKIPAYVVPVTVTLFSFIAMKSGLIKPTTAAAIALVEGGRQLGLCFVQSPKKGKRH